MSRPGADIPRLEVHSRAELHDWLARHHGQSESVWIVSFKKAAGERYLPYEALVDEALAFGWVDSLPRVLDAERSMRLLNPRKPGSAWSRVNKARVARLIAEKRMTPAGEAVVARAKADGSWSKLDGVESLDVPADLARALAAKPGAAAAFDRFPRSSKRLILEWILQARREATRARRVEETATLAARGERAHHYRRAS